MYESYRNYQTWSIYNFIINDEGLYTKYRDLCLRLSKRGDDQDAAQAVRDELREQFNRPGDMISANTSTRHGLYFDILSDALSEVAFDEIAAALYAAAIKEGVEA